MIIVKELGVVATCIMQKKQQSPHERKHTHLLLLLSFQAKCRPNTGQGTGERKEGAGAVTQSKVRSNRIKQNGRSGARNGKKAWHIGFWPSAQFNLVKRALLLSFRTWLCFLNFLHIQKIIFYSYYC